MNVAAPKPRLHAPGFSALPFAAQPDLRNTAAASMPFTAAWAAYATDAAERWVLFLDVLRQRGERYVEHMAKAAPHALRYEFDLLIDGTRLPKPVNYMLVRIVPPPGVVPEERKRPFVVVDPRAGHGPGIGGFKADSEIGVALNAGHPCYFVGFLPEPVAGQTIEDVLDALAMFVEHVGGLHPRAEGKPAVIGNCQAGWAVAMVAARRPELFGPLILAGSPLSYWAGVEAENPMRFSGGLLGGSWLTALTSDLGAGKFDGAWLVSNFENLNPANTLWSKQYNLYSNVDNEAPRYLEFEQWWGGHVFMNASEIQFIVDELFIGNRLARGDIVMSDGKQIDLRAIRSPIVVFCSKGDNITPPPQALDWILDLYDSVEDMRTYGQTIVYAVHETAGHLGIFVSGSVAKKEYHEFASNIDLIDVLPPGLYEAVMIKRPPSDLDARPELIGGDYLVRFETRTFDDIRKLGVNSREDDRRFEAVARLSEMNLSLYRTFVQPWVRMWANEASAQMLRTLHPLRQQYLMFANWPVTGVETVRQNRHAVPKDNVFWRAQEQFSKSMEAYLDYFRDIRDLSCQAVFEAIYGSPVVQAMAGMSAGADAPPRRARSDVSHKAFVAARVEELGNEMHRGGPEEAAIRALLYIRLPDGVADERGFRFLQGLRDSTRDGRTLAEFKALVREQFFMLIIDERAAIAALPEMLARDPQLARRMDDLLRQVIGAMGGPQSDTAKARLAEIQRIFENAAVAPEQRKPAERRMEPKVPQRPTPEQRKH